MSYSLSVDHASAALRRFLLLLDEQALVGTIRFGRKGGDDKAPRERRKAMLGNRWQLPIDLRIGAPFDGRPRSKDGGTSFHLSIKALAKTRASASGSDGSRQEGADAASGFERYVTADFDRALDPPKFERYLDVPPSEWAENINTPSRAVLLVSNISDDPAEREGYWLLATEAERTPGEQRVELFERSGSPADWEALAAEEDIPPAVAEAARAIAAKLQREMAAPSGQARRRKNRRVVKLVSQRDIAWAQALGDRFGTVREARMVHYPRPRAGRVQERLEVELPHELSVQNIRHVVDDLAALLHRIGVRFTLVVHAPDAGNDDRNVHLHILFYASLTSQEGGVWRFGVEQGSPHKMRPGDMAVRLGVMDAADVAGHHHRALAAADMAALRQRYAGLVNQRLAGQGCGRTFDPRSYDDMRIDQTPAVHLNTAAARLVAAGVAVDIDIDDARRSWSAAYRRLDRANSDRGWEHSQVVAGIRTSLERDSVGDAAADALLSAKLERAREISGLILEGHGDLGRFQLDRMLAESAARRLLKNCGRLIEALDAGTASRDDRRNEPHIRRRHRQAQQHLDEIEQALEPWAQDMRAYGLQVEAAERAFTGLVADLDGVIAHRRRARARMDWAAGSVLPKAKYPTPLAGHRHLDALLGYLESGSQKEAARAGWSVPYLVPDAQGRIEILGLKPLDRAVLMSPHLSERAEPALARIAARQNAEVGRLIAFLQAHGAERLMAASRAGGDAPITAIQSLYQVYREHPHFQQALHRVQAKGRKREVLQEAVDRVEYLIPGAIPPVRALPDIYDEQGLRKPPAAMPKQGSPVPDATAAAAPAEDEKAYRKRPVVAPIVHDDAPAVPQPRRPRLWLQNSPDHDMGNARPLRALDRLASVPRLGAAPLMRAPAACDPMPQAIVTPAMRPVAIMGTDTGAAITNSADAPLVVAADLPRTLPTGTAEPASSNPPAKPGNSLAVKTEMVVKPDRPHIDGPSPPMADGESKPPKTRLVDLARAAARARSFAPPPVPVPLPIEPKADKVAAQSGRQGRGIAQPQPLTPFVERKPNRRPPRKSRGERLSAILDDLWQQTSQAPDYWQMPRQDREEVAGLWALVSHYLQAGSAGLSIVDDQLKLATGSDAILADVRRLASIAEGGQLLLCVARQAGDLMDAQNAAGSMPIVVADHATIPNGIGITDRSKGNGL